VIILLQATNLTKTFGGLIAVSNVDIHVGQGEIVGLVGPNGAGKSTLLNLISGIYRPDSGSIIFNGNDITKMPPFKVCKLGITKTFFISSGSTKIVWQRAAASRMDGRASAR
jgi:branched-chain amino acid transport system ATP-binding protein